MAESANAFEASPPGAVAWLEVSADNPGTWPGRPRTGPLGMQITRLRDARAPYLFIGARLRGARCIWSASTVSGAELYRPPRTPTPAPFDSNVQLLARVQSSGTVFESTAAGEGTLSVYESPDEISAQFLANTHVFTLNVPLAMIGFDAASIRQMREQTYDLTPLQSALLRAALGLLVAGTDELATAASLVGVDRYLAALAALLLRTAVARPVADVAQAEQLRLRTDAIIFEQAGDPKLTPAVIAAQLGISLRQLYRGFTGSESPAARIRRRRLDRAAEILATRSGPGDVERVAAECGFVSAEYFSRAFRREFGLSPRAYRSANRDSAAR